MSIMRRYADTRKANLQVMLYQARKLRVCYLFLLPFAALFITFYILPIFTSIRYSFWKEGDR